MFSSLSNLIFGQQSTDEANQGQPKQSETSDQKTLLTISSSSDDDAGWLLVDRPDDADHEFKNDIELQVLKGPELCINTDIAQDLSDDDDQPSPFRFASMTNSSSEELSDFERFRGPFLNTQDLDMQSDAAISDVSSQPEHVNHPSLDECWIVTPPPCFTASASGNRINNIHDSNPLENLLIEHPSMSVYAPYRRQAPVNIRDPSCNVPSASLIAESDFDTEVNAFEVAVEVQVMLPTPLPSMAVVQAPNQFQVPHPAQPARRGRNGEIVIHGTFGASGPWKALEQIKRRQNSRNTLFRQNKVKEFVAQGKVNRRKEHMVNHSGRNNDRKCC